MDIAINHSEDWIPVTSVQMARNRGRRGDFRQFDDYGFIGNRPIYGRNQFNPKRRPPRWRALIIVLVILMIVSFVLPWKSLDTRLQAYVPFAHTAEVAELTILKTREGGDQLSILLTFVDANGFYKPENRPHLIQGDEVILRYEYILVPSWLRFLGLHSGYILISLDGQNKNGTRVSSWHLNEADNDNSFPAQIYAFLISPRYGSITLMPSRSVYKICITSTGLLKEC